MAPDDLYYDFVKRKVGQCPTCGECLTTDHDCGPLYKGKKKEERVEDRLRECPWCQNKAEVHEVDETGCYDRSIRYLYQPGCETELCPGEWGGAVYDSEEEAIKRWNTRSTDPLIKKMAEALEDLDDMFDPTSKVGEIINKALQEYRARQLNTEKGG